jgi:hypothetical protein
MHNITFPIISSFYLIKSFLNANGYLAKKIKDKENNSAWFLVAVFVLAVFGVGLVGAIALYCISKGMQFSGNWNWANGQWTPSVWIECKK